MATRSSVLAWRIPWTEEPGRLPSIGLQKSDTTEATEYTCRKRTEDGYNAPLVGERYSNTLLETSLIVQWLALYTFIAEGLGSSPAQGAKISQAMQSGKK